MSDFPEQLCHYGIATWFEAMGAVGLFTVKAEIHPDKYAVTFAEHFETSPGRTYEMRGAAKSEDDAREAAKSAYDTLKKTPDLRALAPMAPTFDYVLLGVANWKTVVDDVSYDCHVTVRPTEFSVQIHPPRGGGCAFTARAKSYDDALEGARQAYAQLRERL